MTYSFAPDLFQNLLIESLQDEAHPAYGQIATVSSNQEVEVRTVHLRYIPEFETLGFVCHQQSKKMYYLKEHHKTSGCWYDYPRKVQFRFTSKVELITENSKDPLAQSARSRMWKMTRETVRLVYGSQKEFVAVIVKPEWWDFYELKSEDYREHQRRECRWNGKEWKISRIDLLTGKPLG